MVALTGALGYSVAAAATTPFSASANIFTAIPIVGVALAAVVCWPLRAPAGSLRLRPAHGAPTSAGRHPWRAWAALGAVIVGFELFEYLVPGSRGAHPTLSSMVDAVNRSQGLKATV
ncbi:MAG TPA: hypothetical protein VHD39_04240, partial [Acidimicrobiales bacterium]|nr:hypothetical protein [Acidimicrobiales bacterium]